MFTSLFHFFQPTLGSSAQWSDNWSKCAVDVQMLVIGIVASDNTFGKGFDWATAPWFDANGLNDVAKFHRNSC